MEQIELLMLLPNVRGQPRDERLSKTEYGRAIALRCDDWLGSFFIFRRALQLKVKEPIQRNRRNEQKRIPHPSPDSIRGRKINIELAVDRTEQESGE